MHPRTSGQGIFPRYGGGWMHQFGHVYALQQELLNPNANNWFRAVELWHTARQEGVAMNSTHFTAILRQCVQPGAWAQSLQALQQMTREHIRPDVIGVGCALAACVEGKHYVAVEDIFNTFHKSMQLDSVCHLARIRARQECGDTKGAIEAGKQQQQEQAPFLPYTYTHLLEACNVEDDDVYALELVRSMHTEQWAPSQRAAVAMRELGDRHPLIARASEPVLELVDSNSPLSLDASPHSHAHASNEKKP
ncbi:putative mitochondrial hypothetical protein [Leptomonas pyrrhocoris]|uniref:Pentacotripeptide-repeat region of PRORP domain-containing protein n=1 Tax=Leptomonas pyrrhocoris TaxID=157538 RepID=A0A0N0VEU3_LEPPY|nr:putative mitochondrial hypothetical protein [Leptomonas pyrrhocoris]KPA79344.1 putative mitochondrial hypothetical protein [Leptomonas pyrrhocoris]|eukprot:XP_015657783.1 putative mitochondrial hypothetical protein [Leptomonas pyrrhocoris]